MLETLRQWPEWFSHNLDGWVSFFIEWLQVNAQWAFDLIDETLRSLQLPIEDLLLWLPWPFVIALLVGLAAWLGGWRLAVGVGVGMLFIGSMGLWNLAMITLALVLAATALSVFLGVPLGILMAKSDPVNRTLRPGLDFLQTMPSFVYLVPAVLLLSLGRVPALVATVAYAIPPVIRLTNLGIRRVPEETVEAGLAFGSTPGQLLRKVQLPLGFPTIMAGVNQTIMMALAMVIVASLIGAPGLGDEVLVGLSRLDVGRAFNAGLAIVILAIVIDRMSERAGDVGERRRAKRASAASAAGAAAEPEPETSADDGLTAATTDGDEEPVVVIEGLFKIFGPHPKEARRMLEQGESRDDILEQTRSTVAINDVSLEIRPGETFVVMGLSGSGKSTLVRCLNRLIEPTSGTVRIDGEDVGAMDRTALNELRRKKLGMVFQRFALLPHRNVLENVVYGLEVQGVGREERQAAGMRVLGVVGLTGWAHSYPHELSGGMQQRVGLARALANDPSILLMDEPFSALDPLMRRQLQGELTDLQERLRKTIVFITHDLDEALRLGDRIAIMKDGRFVQVGTPEDILLRPADSYVASFIEGQDKSELMRARDVMFRPESRVRVGQPPQVALRTMEHEGLSSAFVVDGRGHLKGLLTADAAVEASKRGVGDVAECIQADVATVGPDEPIRDLIPLAVSERYPIAVIEDGRLLGIVARVSILRGLIGDEGASTGQEPIEEETAPA